MPAFRTQQIGVAGASRLPTATRSNIGEALSSVGQAVGERDARLAKLEAAELKKQDERTVIDLRNQKSLDRSMFEKEQRDESSQTGIYSNNVIDTFDWEENWDKDNLEGHTQGVKDGFSSSDVIARSMAANRTANHAATRTIALNKDTFKDATRTLTEFDGNPEELFAMERQLRESGVLLGISPGEIDKSVDDAVEANFTATMMAPGNFELANDMLDDPDIAGIYTDAEISQLRKAIEKVQGEEVTRISISNMAINKEAYEAAAGMAANGPIGETLKKISQMDVDDATKGLLVKFVHKISGTTPKVLSHLEAKMLSATHTNFSNEALAKLKENHTDIKERMKDLRLKKGNDRQIDLKDYIKYNEEITAIRKQIQEKWVTAVERYANGELTTNDYLNTRRKLSAQDDDLQESQLLLTGRKIDPSWSLKPNAVFHDTYVKQEKLMDDKINAGEGQFKGLSEQDRAFLQNYISSYGLNNGFYDNREEFESTILATHMATAVREGLKALNEQRYPGKTEEEVTRINNADKGRESVVENIRPDAGVISSFSNNPNISDSELRSYLLAEGINADEANDIVESRPVQQISDGPGELEPLFVDTQVAGELEPLIDDTVTLAEPVTPDLVPTEEEAQAREDFVSGRTPESFASARVPGEVSTAQASDDKILTAWTERYQGTNDPKKTARAKRVIKNFKASDVPSSAMKSIELAVDLFAGDMGVSGPTLKRALELTGAIESDYKTKTQRGGGPARSFWQVEPATAKALLVDAEGILGPKFEEEFGSVEELQRLSTKELQDKLLNDQDFAVAMASAKYLTSANAILNG